MLGTDLARPLALTVYTRTPDHPAVVLYTRTPDHPAVVVYTHTPDHPAVVVFTQFHLAWGKFRVKHASETVARERTVHIGAPGVLLGFCLFIIEMKLYIVSLRTVR